MNARIEDRAYGMRSAPERCSVCGVKVDHRLVNREKHRAWHLAKGDPAPNLGDGANVSTSAKARQAALRARARLLLRQSRAQRVAELQRRARVIRGADDWKVFFKARRRLNQIQNERSRMGVELFGDPTAFQRAHR
jgi:hypothetical protein